MSKSRNPSITITMDGDNKFVRFFIAWMKVLCVVLAILAGAAALVGIGFAAFFVGGPGALIFYGLLLFSALFALRTFDDPSPY